MAKMTAEYAQWLEENQFTPEDEQLMLRTVTWHMLLWLALTCVPGLNYFTLPLFMEAWCMRKILKQRNFDPRRGLIFNFCMLAMYITFIMIIPWIIWTIAKKTWFGTGLKRLIRKGKVGMGKREAERAQYAQEAVSAPEALPVVAADSDPAQVQTAQPVAAGAQEQKPAPAASAPRKRPSLLTIGILLISVNALIVFLLPRNTPHNQDHGVLPPEPTSSSSDPNQRLIPDFGTMTDPEMLRQWAQENGMTLHLEYCTQFGNYFSECPEGTIVGIHSQWPEAGATASAGSAVEVILQVQIPTLADKLVGSWYCSKVEWYQLLPTMEVESITFLDDGTFRVYSMHYRPVEEPTDLYAYGRYWSGVSGAREITGTYTCETEIDFIRMEYSFYDWGLEEEKTVVSQCTVYFGENGGVYIQGSDNPLLFDEYYLPGSAPEGDQTLVPGLAGMWAICREPRMSEITGIRTANCVSIWLEHIYSQERGCFTYDAYTYRYGEDGWDLRQLDQFYRGHYTYDGTTLTLHFEYAVIYYYDQDGYSLGMQRYECDFSESYELTILPDGTIVTPGGIERLRFIKDYADADWSEKGPIFLIMDILQEEWP